MSQPECETELVSLPTASSARQRRLDQYYESLSSLRPDDPSLQVPHGWTVGAILGGYLVLCAVSSAFNWNSSPVRYILISLGVFACPAGSVRDRDASCLYQERNLNALLATNMSIASIVSGVLLQLIKPRYLATVGLAVQACGTFMRGFCSPDETLTWIAFTISASGQHIMVIGLSDVSYLFPSFQAASLSLLGLAVSISSFSSNVEYFIFLSTRAGYMAFLFVWSFALACLAAGVFFMVPRKPYSAKNEQSSVEFLKDMSHWRIVGSRRCLVLLIVTSFYQARLLFFFFSNHSGLTMLASPITMVPCVLLGLVFDRTGIFFIVVFINLAAIITTTALAMGSDAFDAVVGLGYIIVSAWVTTMLNVVAFTAFPPETASKAAGVFYAAGGVVATITEVSLGAGEATAAGDLVILLSSFAVMVPCVPYWLEELEAIKIQSVDGGLRLE